jgi:hypothetical protein
MKPPRHTRAAAPKKTMLAISAWRSSGLATAMKRAVRISTSGKRRRSLPGRSPGFQVTGGAVSAGTSRRCEVSPPPSSVRTRRKAQGSPYRMAFMAATTSTAPLRTKVCPPLSVSATSLSPFWRSSLATSSWVDGVSWRSFTFRPPALVHSIVATRKRQETGLLK